MYCIESEKMKKNSKYFLQIGLYSTLVAVSIFFVSIFRPFTIVDNNQSNLICSADKHKYESAPNFIFAINENLDSFNDAKARKLCQFQIIRDYNSTYQTPVQKNYTFLPTMQQESSWLNAFFAGIFILLIGKKIIEFTTHTKIQAIFETNNVLLLFISALYVCAVYLFVLQQPANMLYCKKKVQTQLYNFTQVIKKNGAPEKIEMNEYVQKTMTEMYTTCIQSSNW